MADNHRRNSGVEEIQVVAKSRKPIIAKALFCADKQNSGCSLFSGLQGLVLNLEARLSEFRELSVRIIAVGTASKNDSDFALRIYSGIAVQTELGSADAVAYEDGFAR